MRVFGLVLVLVIVAASAPGCALFGKKDSNGQSSGGFSWFKKKDTTTSPAPPPKFPDPIVAPPGTPPATPTAQNPTSADVASFAGLVIDAFSQPVTNSYVQLVQLDTVKEAGAPIDSPTDGNGYFYIPNLKPGRQYKLIARTKQGDKQLAGIAVRQAPDVHVVIQVKEELATDSIPPIPSGSPKRDAKPAASSGLESSTPPVAIWAPTPIGGQPTAPAPVELPTKLTVPSPVSAPTAAPNAVAPGVAGTNSAWPPPLQINGGPKKNIAPSNPFPAPQPPPLPGDPQSKLTPLVPSTVVVAGTVQILALKDVDEQTWNFHKDRKGKLVLLDFWTRDCIPCRQAMPILSQIQTKLGPQGVEVVGVLLDKGSVRDQAMRAKETCFKLQTNYRQVLGQDDQTRLRQQFNLQYFPTLILLDETGRILWRHEGLPDAAMLEGVLQKRLAASRAF